jgi:hypothetical protein
MGAQSVSRLLKSLIGPLVLVFGVSFSLLILVIVISLTAKVFEQTLGTNSTSSKVPGSLEGASGAPGSPPLNTNSAALPSSSAAASSAMTSVTRGSVPAVAEKSDGEKDALANAMAAIGASVAVITLILTLGTTWLGDLMRKVDSKLALLEEKDRQAERVLVLGAALVRAQVEIGTWLSRSKTKDAAGLATEWGRSLQALSTDDRDLRFSAYFLLWEGLHKHGHQLPQVARYCSLCHEQAVHRLQRLPVHEIQRRVDEGLWCLLFDPMETVRFQRALERS